MTFADLDRFFEPRRVAVVGATDEPGRQSTYAWNQIREWGLRVGAEVLPIHPRRAAVDGVPTHPDLSSVEDGIDVVAVLHAGPEEVVAEAARLEVGFVVVFAAGYAETGEDGAEKQRHLLDGLEGSTTRLIGPNTNLNAFSPLDETLPGPGLAIISQSGHQGRPLYLLQQAGVRITHWAPTGNEADIDTADVIAWLAGRAEVDAIAMYLEGIRDGDRFVEAGRHATRAGVPIVTVKVGRTAVGADAASSHTAAVTSPDAVVDAAFDRAGIVRVDDLDDLSDTAVALARLPEPRTPGIAVYSMSGGACSLTADLLAVADLPVPRLTDETRAALREHIAGFLPVSNPIDCGGPPMADERGRKILDALAADRNIGTVLAVVSGAVPGFTDRLVEDLVDASRAHPDVAFVLVWGTAHLHDPSLERAMADPRLAVFRTASAAARALSRWQAWHDGRRSILEADGVDAALDEDELAADEVGRWPTLDESSEWASREVLARAGVPQAPALLLTDPSEAAGALERLGGPVVLKGAVAGLAHRAQVGLIEIGVTASDAEQRTRALLERAAGYGERTRGVVMAGMVADGPEVLIGAVHDRVFGTVVTVGHGGGAVEELALTATALAPRTTAEARDLLGSVPASEGWTDDVAAFDALVDLVLKISVLARSAGPRLAALEVNPVRLVDGRAIALDAWLGRIPG